jgi:hypothetical protein
MLGEIGGLGPLLVLVMGGLAAALPWLLGRSLRRRKSVRQL